MATIGDKTLAQMRALVQQALGGYSTTTVDDAWYTARINEAYAQVCTFRGPVQINAQRVSNRTLRFFELYQEDDRSISTGMSSNLVTPAITADLVYSVDNVYDLTNDVQLKRQPRRWMLERNPQETGTPRHWCPAGSDTAGYLIYPIPGSSSDVISVRETTYTYPTALSADGDTPVIPGTWHNAIVYRAIADAAMILDIPEKAQEYDAYFQGFIATRKSPVEETGPAGGRKYFRVG